MPRRYDWFFKEVFLILSAPIFWALLTNFGRVWRFIDDRYYHKEAKQYRKDKRDAKRLHFELTGHYEYYHYHLSDRAEDFCAAFLKKLGCVINIVLTFFFSSAIYLFLLIKNPLS